MNQKKIVYETQWTAVDPTKEYPHGYGFTAPIVEFPEGADPAWCGEMCRQHLSNEEFECIGAFPRSVLDGSFALDYPKDAQQYEQWKRKSNKE